MRALLVPLRAVVCFAASMACSGALVGEWHADHQALMGAGTHRRVRLMVDSQLVCQARRPEGP